MSVYESSSNYPSEAWLFAQLLLGKPIPAPPVMNEGDREAATIRESATAPHFESRFRSTPSIENSSLAWAALISESAATKLRSIKLKEDAARSSYASWQRYFNQYSATLEDWNEAEHPRHPKGTSVGGQFAPKNGGIQAGSSTQPTSSHVPADGNSPAPSVPSSNQPPPTKVHLPADHRGTWVSGTKGNGSFRYNDSIENQKVGLAGREVRFENNYIAKGGFPAESYYGGNAASASVEISERTGTSVDSAAADAAMRKKLGDPNWERPIGYRWNHAGPPGSKTMELMDLKTHSRMAHKGWAAIPRAEARPPKSTRTAGRAIGAVTVYLAVRDGLQAAGLLQPDYDTGEKQTYRYRAEDGSEFVVYPGGLFSQSRREYIAGPRKGETESISSDAVEAHRRQAEEEFGKYVPGTIFKQPRFISGKQRSTIPLIIEKYGIPHHAGWIDENGVHYFETPLPLPI